MQKNFSIRQPVLLVTLQKQFWAASRDGAIFSGESLQRQLESPWNIFVELVRLE